jgi:hypothetical protein
MNGYRCLGESWKTLVMIHDHFGLQLHDVSLDSQKILTILGRQKSGTMNSRELGKRSSIQT